MQSPFIPVDYSDSVIPRVLPTPRAAPLLRTSAGVGIAAEDVTDYSLDQMNQSQVQPIRYPIHQSAEKKERAGDQVVDDCVVEIHQYLVTDTLVP
jgi:hypothetical protein